nr:PREDICTED: uncharacterized protein LOC107398048 isoform X3 [Tribolium castaneum]|eukprot:XP_015836256.1 PREDICTED: uncharacterized protein LOC107398048 isoform X3 [Tribolium castaneum]
MLDAWERLTFYPFKWISLGGLHPQNDRLVAKFLFLYNFAGFGTILGLAITQIYLSYENIYYTIDSILTIVLYLHIASKYVNLHLHKDTLAMLIQERSKFWPIDTFEMTVRQKCVRILTKSLTIIKSYLGYSLLVVISFLIQPIITGQLPVFIEFGLLNKIKCLTYFIMQIIETGIYCFTAQLISESSENVGNAVYKAPWYDFNCGTRRDIALVIVRSQKKVVFNGLGLVWIKMETFTKIFKTALSFYTYLNTMVYQN